MQHALAGSTRGCRKACRSDFGHQGVPCAARTAGLAGLFAGRTFLKARSGPRRGGSVRKVVDPEMLDLKASGSSCAWISRPDSMNGRITDDTRNPGLLPASGTTRPGPRPWLLRLDLAAPRGEPTPSSASSQVAITVGTPWARRLRDRLHRDACKAGRWPRPERLLTWRWLENLASNPEEEKNDPVLQRASPLSRTVRPTTRSGRATGRTRRSRRWPGLLPTAGCRMLMRRRSAYLERERSDSHHADSSLYISKSARRGICRGEDDRRAEAPRSDSGPPSPSACRQPASAEPGRARPTRAPVARPNASLTYRSRARRARSQTPGRSLPRGGSAGFEQRHVARRPGAGHACFAASRCSRSRRRRDAQGVPTGDPRPA